MPKTNEINSIKLAILKSLYSGCHARFGKYTSIKTVGVDLPLSPKVFIDQFPLAYNGENSIRAVMLISELSKIFGKNWHTVRYSKSSTRKRVFGVIKIHYRKKKIALNTQERNDR